MTREDWLARFNQHKEVLTSFVAGWHPRSILYGKQENVELPITAPNAEIACEEARSQIGPVDVFKKWSKAVQEQDADTLSQMLSSAWFGVPESTSCWQITGFKEAVDLLDDPIEYDEPPEDMETPPAGQLEG